MKKSVKRPQQSPTTKAKINLKVGHCKSALKGFKKRISFDE